MKRKTLIIVALAAILTSLTVMAVGAADRSDLGRRQAGRADLAEVRRATAQFQRVEVAEAAGYELASPCVAHPQLGGMGYHYVNFGLVDLELDPVQPEILVYAPSPSGNLKLVAVEYAVPIDLWDADDPPSVLGQELHPNPVLGLYVLHAWVWHNNPAGMFEDWNPRVSCP